MDGQKQQKTIRKYEEELKKDGWAYFLEYTIKDKLSQYEFEVEFYGNMLDGDGETYIMTKSYFSETGHTTEIPEIKHEEKYINVIKEICDIIGVKPNKIGWKLSTSFG